MKIKKNRVMNTRNLWILSCGLLLAALLGACISLSDFVESDIKDEMKELLQKKIPNYIENVILWKDALHKSNNLILTQKGLSGWIVEGFSFEENTSTLAETYEKKYEGKKEELVDQYTGSHYWKGLTSDDVSTDNMVLSCGEWVSYTGNLNSINVKRLSSMFDSRCYRLITPDKERAYDVISTVHKKDVFIKANSNLKSLMKKEVKKLIEENQWSLFRHAFDSIEVIEQSLKEFGDYTLVQLLVRRYTIKSFMHVRVGKKRLRNTYIFILTGKKVRIVIQTFPPFQAKASEIEKDLKTILTSVAFKE
ncbi:MAG: hypothetical protein IEMM0008_1158 [bacterium]|nr:MAG: hypothetical protein IEMM0008_1158 [bacterium]